MAVRAVMVHILECVHTEGDQTAAGRTPEGTDTAPESTLVTQAWGCGVDRGKRMVLGQQGREPQSCERKRDRKIQRDSGVLEAGR